MEPTGIDVTTPEDAAQPPMPRATDANTHESTRDQQPSRSQLAPQQGTHSTCVSCSVPPHG